MTELPLLGATPVAALDDAPAMALAALLLTLLGAGIAAWCAGRAISGPGRDGLLRWLAPLPARERATWLLDEAQRVLGRWLDGPGGSPAGSAFDRCAVLALPLPFLCLLLPWIAFGWAEPLGNQLGLASAAAPWRRILAAVGLVAVLIAYACMRGGGLLRQLGWGIGAFVVAAEVARLVAGHDAADAATFVVAFGAIAIATHARNPGGLASPGLGLVAASIGAAATVVGLEAAAGLRPGEAVTPALAGGFLAGFAALLLGHLALRHDRLGLLWCIAWPAAILASLGILRLGLQAETAYPTLRMIALFTLLPLLMQPCLAVTLAIGRALHRRGFSARPAIMGSLHVLLSLPVVPLLAAALYLAMLGTDILAVSVGNLEFFGAPDIPDNLRLLAHLVIFASLYAIVLVPMLPSLGTTAVASCGPVCAALRVPHAALRTRLRTAAEGAPPAGQPVAHALLVALVAVEVLLAILLALLLAGGALSLAVASLPSALPGFIDGLEGLGGTLAAWLLRGA
jgi:hypothetical protein